MFKTVVSEDVCAHACVFIVLFCTITYTEYNCSIQTSVSGTTTTIGVGAQSTLGGKTFLFQNMCMKN